MAAQPVHQLSGNSYKAGNWEEPVVSRVVKTYWEQSEATNKIVLTRSVQFNVAFRCSVGVCGYVGTNSELSCLAVKITCYISECSFSKMIETGANLVTFNLTLYAPCVILQYIKNK